MKISELEPWQMSLISLISVIFLCFIIGFIFDGREKRLEKENQFFRIDFQEEIFGFGLYVDRETRVQYLYKGDAMTLYVDSEGKPILYKGSFEE